MAQDNEKKQNMRAPGDFADGALDCGERGKRIHCLTIIGQIEGHYLLPDNQKATKYEHLIPELIRCEQDPEIRGVLIVLNTVGGDVEAGLALSELISGMSKPTVSLVLGGGHSIGVPLAVSARKSFIVPSATMTIHPVRTTGLVVGVRQSFDYFRQMQNRITDFIVAHSNVQRKKLNELMLRPDEMATDVGSVVDGREAVDIGLIDRVGGLSDALSSLYDAAGIDIGRKLPKDRETFPSEDNTQDEK